MSVNEEIRLLLVDDESAFLSALATRLSMRDFDVTAVESGQQAIAAARETDFDVAVVDLKMPGMSGEELLRRLKEEHSTLEVVVLTGHASIPSAVECTKDGSFHYLQKPCQTDELLEVLRQAYERHVARKHELSEKRMEELLKAVEGESPLAILRRLREVDRG